MKIGPVLANSNEKMPSGGGSKVQINNYFTMGNQQNSGQVLSGSAVKSEIKRKRKSQNLQSNAILQLQPTSNYMAVNEHISQQQLKQQQMFSNTLNLSELHTLLQESGVNAGGSQPKISGVQQHGERTVQKERKKNYQKLKEHQYMNSSFLNNPIKEACSQGTQARKQSTPSTYTTKASQKRKSGVGLPEDIGLV
jgi:hypothetical protein